MPRPSTTARSIVQAPKALACPGRGKVTRRLTQDAFLLRAGPTHLKVIQVGTSQIQVIEGPPRTGVVSRA